MQNYLLKILNNNKSMSFLNLAFHINIYNFIYLFKYIKQNFINNFQLGINVFI